MQDQPLRREEKRKMDDKIKYGTLRDTIIKTLETFRVPITAANLIKELGAHDCYPVESVLYVTLSNMKKNGKIKCVENNCCKECGGRVKAYYV